MRKLFFAIVMLCLVCFCACASADSFSVGSIHATFEIDDDYIILTPDNLGLHPEWINDTMKTTADALLADYEARGVIVQAWNKAGDVCLEVTAVADDMAQSLFDIDQQTTNTRTSYRTSHTKGTLYADEGHKYSEAEWKKTNQYGRFLQLKYTCARDGETYKGFQRRTVRNGYTITVDCKVYGRSLKNTDRNAVDAIMKTWKFTTVLPKPDDCVAKLIINSKPPLETSTGKFSVEGTGDPGLKIIAVLMRMASPDPITMEETVSSKGTFSIDAALPKEGVWMMTLTVLNGETVTEEIFFDATSYDKGLLTVNLDAEIPTVLTSDSLTISGKTMKQTTVQCVVDGVYTKSVKTNNSGKFSFHIPTKLEGDYDITLVFEKKNYDTRRMQFTANRTLTEEDKRSHIRAEAVKPAYSTLTDKITGYTGRTMGYTLYVVSIEPSGDEWISFMAMRKTSKGDYKERIVVMSADEPTFSVGDKIKMYGTCTGEYTVEGVDKNTDYPSFDLLFWEQP